MIFNLAAAALVIVQNNTYVSEIMIGLVSAELGFSVILIILIILYIVDIDYDQNPFKIIPLIGVVICNIVFSVLLITNHNAHINIDQNIYNFSIAIIVISSLNILNLFKIYNVIFCEIPYNDEHNDCNTYDCACCHIKFTCCECI